MATPRRKHVHFALVSLCQILTPVFLPRWDHPSPRNWPAICPNNIATTISDFIAAFYKDLVTILRLVLSCFGPGGPTACVCNILSKPLNRFKPRQFAHECQAL